MAVNKGISTEADTGNGAISRDIPAVTHGVGDSIQETLQDMPDQNDSWFNRARGADTFDLVVDVLGHYIGNYNPIIGGNVEKSRVGLTIVRNILQVKIGDLDIDSTKMQTLAEIIDRMTDFDDEDGYFSMVDDTETLFRNLS